MKTVTERYLKGDDVPWERYVLAKIAYQLIRQKGVDFTSQLFADALRLIPVAELEPSIVELAAQVVSVVTPDTPSFYREDQRKKEAKALK